MHGQMCLRNWIRLQYLSAGELARQRRHRLLSTFCGFFQKSRRLDARSVSTWRNASNSSGLLPHGPFELETTGVRQEEANRVDRNEPGTLQKSRRLLWSRSGISAVYDCGVRPFQRDGATSAGQDSAGGSGQRSLTCSTGSAQVGSLLEGRMDKTRPPIKAKTKYSCLPFQLIS